MKLQAARKPKYQNNSRPVSNSSRTYLYKCIIFQLPQQSVHIDSTHARRFSEKSFRVIEMPLSVQGLNECCVP